MKKLLIYIVILLPLWLSAQEKQLSLKILIHKDTVLLRWAPSNYSIWQKGNFSGYKIERYEIPEIVNSSIIPQANLLNRNPILPWPYSALDTIAEDDQYTAIALQAIHGEKFEISSPLENKSAYKEYNKDMQMRFGFALLSADLSHNAALAHGLFYKDIVPDTTKKYLYKVSFVDTSLKNIDAVVLFERFRKTNEPIPMLQVIFSDKCATLGWDKKFIQDYYSGYIIERSEDKGKTFKILNQTPFVPIENKEQNENIFYVDSLPNNNNEFQYRVSGLNCFARKGAPSNIVKGKGIQTFSSLAFIDSIASLPNKTVHLTWKIDPKDKDLITGFDILRSSNLKEDQWLNLNKTKLSRNTRSFTDKNPIEYGYYKVQTYGPNEQSTYSLMRVGLLIDSVPPPTPTDISGIIDKNGKVSLQWKSVGVADLQGYRIFRGNAMEEIVEVTDSLCKTELFVDSIDNQMSPYIFYRIAAVDYNFNRSELSPPIRLMRPDTVPPAQVLITNIKAGLSSISFDWIASPSRDIKMYKIFRIHATNHDTTLLQEIENAPVKNHFEDKKVIQETNYYYAIAAMDVSGNIAYTRSGITCAGNGLLPAVEKMITTVDRNKQCITLNWEYNFKDIIQFTIFRAKEGEKPVSLAIVDGNTKSYTDKAVSPNNKYIYFIQAERNDYKVSEGGKEVKVVY